MAVSCSENQWGSWSCKPCGNYGGTQHNTDPDMSLEDAIDRCNGASMANPNPNPAVLPQYTTKKCTCSRTGVKERDCTCGKFSGNKAMPINNNNMRRNIKQRNWAGSSARMGRGVSQPIPLSAAGVSGGCPSGCVPCLLSGGCCEAGFGTGSVDGKPCGSSARRGRRPMSRKELDKRIRQYKSFSGNYKGLQQRLNKNFGLGYRNYFVNLADLRVEF